jgi:uncharacterized protein YuzE
MTAHCVNTDMRLYHRHKRAQCVSKPEVHTMKISYDKATDSLYIHLADRASVDSDEVKDGVVLDFDANGALVGIDVQHASERADINNLSVSKMPLGELLAV